ncbi:hypothetical protein CONPUDRAFT_150710 [Coniophora puteana RWD-64-598 SS2]|uniref:Uncharacterized protein n=1 Tax=Coniophora puteana (strain RWD-64-598) TaxID=741705 RepID=A0A5M3MWW8_CONPW|nr:uncharacterized protein CONPUDRAFT_150710 [Coniophora puteana RWD-64-598 SS2]EIW83639.1 hypothetical protein CONPUDRAFT_150710 [Coniophora puteana RWD-64-598 SS2]
MRPPSSPPTALSPHTMLVKTRGITPTPSILDGSNPDLAAEARFTASIEIIGSMTVGGMFYGFATATAGICAYTLIQSRQPRSRRRLAFLLAYIGVIWAAGTLDLAGVTWGRVCAIVYHPSESLSTPDPQDYGPQAIGFVTNIAYWLILLLSDAMMIWRFQVVWSDSAFFRYLVIFPILCYLGVLVPGFFVFILFDDASIWWSATVGADLTTAVFLSSFCLNIYITTLISGRLILYRRRFKNYLGSPDAKHYTSYGAILVESYSPLSFCSIAFFVTYFTDNPAQYMLAEVQDQMQVTAPLLVMLRVSHGIAWDSSMTPQSVEAAVDRAVEAALG